MNGLIFNQEIMRNIKELLQIVRDNIEKYFNNSSDGICIVLIDLRNNKIIDFEEEMWMLTFIDATKPAKPEWRNSYKLDGYGWEPGELQPRLDYLDEYLSKSLEELEEILK